MATFTSFKDLVKKALPISKRGATWIDWNNTATSPVRYVNDLFYAKELDLEFFSRHSASTKTIPMLLNDLYDPFHRNISVTVINDTSVQDGFTINVPTYIAFGNWEELMQATLDRYLYLGVTGSFQTYDSGVSHEAEDYLNQLESNLVGDEVLTDTEIWAVQFVYNQLKGAGILQDFAILHLYSQSSKINAEVDFMSPGTGLIEIPSGGSADWNVKGIASDGLAYYRSGKVLNTLISDVENHCAVLHISEDSGQSSDKREYGVRIAAIEDSFSARFNANNLRYRVNSGNDFELPNTNAVGAYMTYVDSARANIIKDGVVLSVSGFDIGVPVGMPAGEDYINAANSLGSPFGKSKNRICTWGRIDSSLNDTNRKFVNQILTEYNNRLNR